MDLDSHLKDWHRMNVEDFPLEPKKGAFSSMNRAKTKEGIFRFSASSFSFESIKKCSDLYLAKLIYLEDQFEPVLGKSYKKQADSIKDGVVGIVHWYIGQWLKTETIESDGDVLPLKALYVMEGEELYLGALFLYYTRVTGHPHYALLGNILNTYIDWLVCSKNNDFQEAQSLASKLFTFGYEMARAENEGKIIAGATRVSKLAQSNKSDREIRKKKALELAPIYVKKIRESGKKVTKTEVIARVSTEMKLSKDTIKDYFKHLNIKDM